MRRLLRAGMCLLGGQHTPGSAWAKECPLRGIPRQGAQAPQEGPPTQDAGIDSKAPRAHRPRPRAR
jgi:hypothetical protein